MKRDTRTVDDLLREWADADPNHLDEAKTEHAQQVAGYAGVLEREGFRVQNTKPLDGDLLWIEGTWKGRKASLKLAFGNDAKGIGKGPLVYADLDDVNVYDEGWTNQPRLDPSGWKKRLEALGSKLAGSNRANRFTGSDDDVTIRDKSGKVVFNSSQRGVKS